MIIEVNTIEYNRNKEKGVLSTPCPYGTGFMVGSIACGSCQFSKGINFKDHYVYCNKEIDNGKK